MEENLYKVEKIRRKKFDENRKEWLYLVKWQGYDTDESTWEPEENLCYIPLLVENFNKKWDAKQSLVKKKKEKKLENLVTKKRLKQMKQSVDAETSELVRRTEESLLLIDEEDKVKEEVLPQIQVFVGLSVGEGDVYKDTVCKIVGLREYRGKIYASVMFKVSNGRVLRMAVIDLQTLKNTSPKLFREYLKKNVI